MRAKLGNLNRVDIREVWQNEEQHFTPWLAEETNLTQLGDELGIGIELIQTEAKIGKYELDILAQEEGTDNKLIIENQLEPSDHTHLGQLITYASGVDAAYIVWIVRDANDEHIRAIDWLNEHTEAEISFFLVQLELWQIGDSDPAPKFTVICRPNDWAKTARDSVQEGELSGAKAQQLEFWSRLKTYGEENKVPLRFRKPWPRAWYDIAVGIHSCHIALIADIKNSKIRCELYIPDDKDFFNRLQTMQGKIKEELAPSGELEWQPLLDRKACRIRETKPFDFDRGDWIVAIQWLAERALTYKNVFKKYSEILEF